MATALLWLFVITLGIALGAGLYEHRIVVPEWIGPGPDGLPHWNADAARLADTGRRFWVYVTTVPLTLLTLANLVVAWRARPPAVATSSVDSPAGADAFLHREAPAP